MTLPVSEATRAVASLITAWSGILIPEYRLPMLQAEITRLDAGTAGELIDRLRSGEPEARQLLLHAVAIPETYFFRHPEQFETLAEVARARLAAGHGCHVLSAGAATGEEAWSASAVLASVYPAEDRQRCSVTAWELDASRLQRAARGRYPNWSARRGFFGYERFFHRCDNGWQVDPKLGRMVRWQQVNLVADPFPPEQFFDVIFFRNVAIYWAPERAHEVVARLNARLAPDGRLLIAAIDPVALETDRRDGSAPAQPSPPRRARTAPAAVVAAPPAEPAASADELDEVRRLADLGRYTEALALLDELPQPMPVPALQWKGILLLSTGDLRGAEAALTQCAFLEPDQPAHRHWLALVLESIGRTRDATRERRNARELEEA